MNKAFGRSIQLFLKIPMQNRTSLILSFVIVLMCQNLKAQLELGTHFMRDLVQSSRSNPAFFVQDEITIALPSFHGGFFNDHFNASAALSHENNLFTLNVAALDRASETNGLHFQNNLHLETIAINYQRDNWRLDVSQSFRFINEFSSSPETSSFLLKGNAAFLDEEVNLDAKNDLLLYNELALGFGYKVFPGITFGARIKYLSGIANMQTETTTLKVNTNSSDLSINSRGSYLINTAGLFESNGDGHQGIKNFNYSDSFFGESNGFGLDIGLDFDIDENIQIAASINNIGVINWNENTRQFSTSGNKSYESSIPALNGDIPINFSMISDSLQQALGFTDQVQEYSSKLPMSIYLSGFYKAAKEINIGLLYGYATFEDNEAHYASLHIDKKFGKNLRLGSQYSYQFGEHHSIGLNAILDIKGVQIYFQTDNVLPIFDILDSKYYNLRCGINVGLNSKSKKNLNLLSEKKTTDVEVNESEEIVVLEKQRNEENSAEIKKSEAAIKKERKKQLKANEKLVKAGLKERRQAEAKKAKAEKRKELVIAEIVLEEPILPDVEITETKTEEEAIKEIVEIPKKDVTEDTTTTTNIENRSAMDAEAEQQKKREAFERKAFAENQRKQRETEARLLAEAKSREEARIKEESRIREEARIKEQANRQNQTTDVTEQKMVTSPPVTSTNPTLGSKKLTDKTSLRQTADSKSKVLRRFAIGDVVSVLEKTNVYWWKVEFKGQIGWVKARLLK